MIKEIRNQTTEKIKETIIQLKSRLLEYRFQLAQGSFTSFHLVKESKKTIARLLTILKERNETLTQKDWNNFLKSSQEEKKINKTENIKTAEITKTAEEENLIDVKNNAKVKEKIKKIENKTKEEVKPKKSVEKNKDKIEKVVKNKKIVKQTSKKIIK